MSERLTLVKALNLAMRDAMRADDRVLMAGEDIGSLGGVFRATDGLLAEFGERRVLDTPLAESGIVGTAIGLAMKGFRPVLEVQFDGFVFPAFAQIVSQLARLRYRTHGRVAMPVVLRMPYGGHIGAVEHHSESPESYFVLTPGLKVVTPATPQDAYWMMRQAIDSDDPVVFLEPKRRYHEKGDVDLDAAAIGLHSAQVVRPGADLTLACWGPSVRLCLEVAEAAAEEGRNLEVLDLRSLSPIDWDAIYDSARRTSRLVVVHEAQRTLGVGAEIAARVGEELFYDLEAPVARVTGYDLPFPPSRVEGDFLPDLDRILDVVDKTFAH